MRAAIQARVIEQLVYFAGKAAETIRPEHTLDGLGLDSLDKIEFVMALEEEFRCEIDDAEAEKIVTVGDAVALVERLLKAPA